MADNSTNLHRNSSGQGNNIPNTSPTHIPEVHRSSQPDHGKTCEISYEHIRAIHPTTCCFEKAIGLILGVQNLCYFLKKNATIPTGIVVSIVEDLVLTTLEELSETTENAEKPEQPPSFNDGDRDDVLLSNDTFHGLSDDEEEEEDPLEFDKEEEHKEKYTVDQDLD